MMKLVIVGNELEVEVTSYISTQVQVGVAIAK